MCGHGSSPARASNLAGVVAIRTARHSLALKADGTVWAWGNNGSGQLGDGTFTNRSTPARVPNLPGVTAIANGIGHSLAPATDGQGWAWGVNQYGQLGNGTITPDPPAGIPNPVQVLGAEGSGFLTGPVALSGADGTHRLSVELAAPYSWSGVLQPVNADGSSIFKRNSTVQ